MKTIKKLMTLVLSIAMVLAMSVTAFAEDATTSTYKITIKNATAGHTYEAYQIFKGDLSGNILSNVVWGDGITEDGKVHFGDAAEKAESLKTSEEAAAFAKEIGNPKNSENYLVTDKKIEGIYKNGKYEISGLVAGYYFVKDTTNLNGKDDFNTAYIMQVVKDVDVTPKGEKPSVEKKVKENQKYGDGGYGAGYNDVADYNIGDTVPFKLIGTVPDMSGYTSYQYTFHDTMSKGLTLDTKSIKVYVEDDKAVVTKDKEITSYFNISSEAEKDKNGNETGATVITVSTNKLNDIKEVSKGKYIIVEYNATLNTSAEIGLPGNPNKVSLEYSNNPNQGGTGKTQEDHVIVFTYELDTTKVDGNNNKIKLKDAEFKLKNAAGKWAVLDKGKVSRWLDADADATVLTSNEDGFFAVTGLDAGTYYLKETKAPAGYNLPTSEFEIVITATTTNGQNWTNNTPSAALTNIEVTAGGTVGTGDVDKGIAAITVVNNQGSTLPSTGGMGTTIFYVVGTILVLAAVVLLITKKRMHADK